MKDRIIRGIAGNKQVRYFAVNCTETLKEAQRIHNLSITASVLTGRLLAAGLMMGYDMKDADNSLTIKLNTEGDVKHVILTSDNQGHIKCYLDNPQAERELNKAGRIDVSGLIGGGVLTIIREIKGRNPYMGSVELRTGEIASDLAYYYVQSEQKPTAIGLGVLIDKDGGIQQAGGFMVQLLPDAQEEAIEQLEKNLSALPNFSDLMDMGYKIEDILQNMILKDMDSIILATQDAEYRCDCSEEKFEAGISLLNNEELQEYLDKKEPVIVQCHFCNKTYKFGEEVIRKYLK